MKKGVWFGLAMMALVVIGLFGAMPSREHMTNGHLGLLMLGLIVVAIMLGFPTAFTLMGLGTMFTWFAYYSVDPSTAVRQTLDLMVQRAYWVMNNDVLISVPLFVFMGYLVERANLIERLFKSLHLATCAHPRIVGRRDGRDLRDLRLRFRHHRRGGDAHGPARVSGDAQGRIQHPARGGRRDRGRHPRHPDPAVGAPDPLRRHRRRFGDAALRGRLLPGPHAGGALHRGHHHLRETQAQRRAAAVRGRQARGAAEIRGRPLPGRQQRRGGADRRDQGPAEPPTSRGPSCSGTWASRCCRRWRPCWSWARSISA